MIFNTAVFLYFFLTVYALYIVFGWSKKRGHGMQNTLLLAASYFFYGWWDWLYLGLLILTTAVDWYVGLLIDRTESERKRKILLAVSMIANLTVLFTFKYYNFFMDSFIVLGNNLHAATGASFFKVNPDGLLLNVLLPVGISFYTFQSMSYTIDVYRRLLKAEKSLHDFALFVSFFPQLVAGPIERAPDLLPQVKAPRLVTFEHVWAGIWYCLAGFFMKVVVADHLSEYVDIVFLDPVTYRLNPALAGGHSPGSVIIATIAFVFQVYCDFAGYSNIARGTASMMGFRLTENFAYPWFSTNPAQFYERWHMTFYRWLRDYVYYPLGGSRVSLLYQYRNVAVVFLVSGIWHGANWTYVIWGVANGIFLIVYLVLARHVAPVLPERVRAFLPDWTKKTIGLLLTTGSFTFGGLFFRAYDFAQAKLLLRSLFGLDRVVQQHNVEAMTGSVLKFIIPVLILDYVRFKFGDGWILHQRAWLQASAFLILFLWIILGGIFGKSVIYFAF